MSELVSLQAKKPTRNQEVIDTLTSALELANTGELRDIGVVGNMSGGRIFSSASSTDDVGKMVGALEMLKHRLLRNHEND